MKGEIVMKRNHVIGEFINVDTTPFTIYDPIVDPFEEMSAVLYQVNQAFEALFERCKINYIEFDRWLYINDSTTAKALAQLWGEINGDIIGQYQSGDLSFLSLQRWQQALLEWKDRTLEAVQQFANNEIQLDLKSAQPVPYYIEAA
jgi:hypothetical protein